MYLVSRNFSKHCYCKDYMILFVIIDLLLHKAYEYNYNEWHFCSYSYKCYYYHFWKISHSRVVVFNVFNSLLDNAPNYLVGYVIQKRIYLVLKFWYWFFREINFTKISWNWFHEKRKKNCTYCMVSS